MPVLPGISNVERVNPQAQRAPALRSPLDRSGEALQVAGGQAAQAIDRLVAAEKRVLSREDTIRRVRDKAAFNQFALDEIARMRTEEDLTDPDVSTRFGQMLRERSQEILEAHTGSEESRLQLEADLQGIIGAHAGAFGKEVTAEQKGFIDREYDAAVQFELQDIDPSEQGVLDAFSRLERRAEVFAPALTRGEEEEKLTAAKEQAVLAAVDELISGGTEEGLAQAEQILSSENVVPVVSVGNAQKIKAKIRAERAKVEKGRREGEQAVVKAATILGVQPEDLTPAQRRQIANIKPTERETLQGKITALQTAMGPGFEITNDHISQLAGVDDDAFGRGMAARLTQRVTDDAPAFANNLLSPEDDRRYIASVIELQQPVTFPNPDTGVLETRSRELAPFVQDALRRRGMGNLIRQQPRRGAPSPAEVTGEGPPAPQPVPITPEVQTGQQFEVGPERTVFEMAGDVTGPISVGADALQGTPVIGEFVDVPSVTTARNFVTQMTRDLVRVLQNNPKFAEAERKAIEADVDLKGEFFDTTKAFRLRMAGMDDALAVREQNALETATNDMVTRDERQHALNVFNGIRQFRDRLGVPPLMRTPQEAKQLPPGTIFRDPQGVFRTVPGTPKAE